MTRLTSITTVTSTQPTRWVPNDDCTWSAPVEAPDIVVGLDEPQQDFEGFGVALSGQGWQAMQALGGFERDGVLREIFEPGLGANLSWCRVDDAEDDFSTDDPEAAINFARAALDKNTSLKVLAVSTTGATARNLVDACHDAGLDPTVVMLGKELDADDPAPTVDLVAALGPELDERGIELFLGALRSSDDRQIQQVIEQCGVRIAGVGVEQDGRLAAPFVRRTNPGLRIHQTCQEGGDGSNSWRFARHTWTRIRDHIRSGANAYHYGQLILSEGPRGRSGSSTNSLVTVINGEFPEWNHDYIVLRHVSHFVQTGALVLPTSSRTGYENQLCFANPDGSIVLVIQNEAGFEQRPTVQLGESFVQLVLPPDSLSSIVLSGNATIE